MILHSVKLSGWRNFLEEVSVGPFSDGLNVVYAPNGTGKSTLFEALRRGLLDAHSVGGDEIKDIQPWGRSLSPAVTIEFANDGTEYRISKQFLGGAHTKLERKEEGKYRPLATGRSADDHVRTLLTKNPPSRGLSQPKNWGLAQALWATQGDLALLELSGDVVSDIRDALGVQLTETSAGPIEKRVEEIFLEIFSPKGKLKTGSSAPELVHLQSSLEEARTEHREASARLVEYEETSRKVEDLQARRIQTRLDAKELSETIKQTRARAEEYRKLASNAQETTATASAAEARHEQLKQQLNLIHDTKKELMETKVELDNPSIDVESKHREVEARELELANAKIALEDSQTGGAAVDKAEQKAQAAHQIVLSEDELKFLKKRISRIEMAVKRLDAAKKLRADFVAPDRRTITALRRATKKRDDAQVRIDASMIMLEVVPIKDGEVNVIAGEKTGKRKLVSRKPMQIMGSPEIVAEIKGVARLRASGPTGDIEEHRESLVRAEIRIKELAAPYDTHDIETLEALLEKANELDSSLENAETEVDTLLDDDVLDDLKQQRAVQKKVSDKLLGEYPEWKKSHPKPDALKTRASELKRAFDEKVADAVSKEKKADTAFSESSNQEQVMITRRDSIQKQVDRLQTRATELTANGNDPKKLEKEVKKMLLAWQAADAKREEIQNKLDAYEDDPSAALEKLEKQLSKADKTAEAARDKETNVEGRLESLAATGPYSAFVAAEEETARLDEAVNREQLRTDAIKLLYDMVGECRSEAIFAVAKPVERTATRLLQRIAGPRMGDIRLGDSLTPIGVVPKAAESSVGVENLSGGEKEQLYLATRLALAEVLAADERQLVVLDDVLTATDPGRLARIMTILEEMAQHLQILILTCHPEWYRGLADADFFDLESLVLDGVAD